MSQITQMDLINAQIEYGAKGTSNKDITKNILNEWRGSQPIEDMIEAANYYKVQNTEIEKKTRSYKDEAGRLILNENLSNIKSKTAQYRKSVNQKYNFALAKPFIISCNQDNYKEEWNKFLNNKTRAVIQRTGKDGINKGIGWVYPYIDKNGELQLLDLEPETIYPAWTDRAHTELDAIVRDYTITEYNNLTPTDVRKVEFWDRQIVEKYIDYSMGEGKSNGDLEIDNEDNQYELKEGEEERATVQMTHLSKADGTGVSWDRVPFIAFKGCEDELPLLNECKTDIDGYDMLKSKSIDSLLDDIDATIVIEGIGAEMGKLTEARKMIQNSRIIAIDPGGKAYTLKVDTDIGQVANELEIIKKDIQDNTSTVDLTTIKLGTNPSGESMKSFYESLNTWCNGFEAEFTAFMNNLKYFFDMWLSWKGGFGTFEQLQAIDISFNLDRDMMINETEIIENIVKMKDELSQETLDEINPWVDDPEKEKQRREEDEKRLAEKQELYNFENLDNENDNSNEDDEETDENDQRE